MSKLKIDKNENRFWYNEKGKLHRENGPAIESMNGTKSWWIHGVRHREDGPAIEWADGNKSWFINGKELIKNQ